MKSCGFLLPWAVWSSRPHGPRRPAVQAATTVAFPRSNSSAEMTPVAQVGQFGQLVRGAGRGTRRGLPDVLAELPILPSLTTIDAHVPPG
jgi:hypothetical protein